jgi:hypothetical protein
MLREFCFVEALRVMKFFNFHFHHILRILHTHTQTSKHTRDEESKKAFHENSIKSSNNEHGKEASACSVPCAHRKTRKNATQKAALVSHQHKYF